LTSLAYRRAIEDDMRFIVESFLESFRTCYSAGLIAMDDWYTVMRPQAQKLFARPGAEQYVAHHPGEEFKGVDLYGFIAVERGHESPVVVYVYVKSDYRRQGLARGLFAAAGIDPRRAFVYVARTAIAMKLRDKAPLARWSPLTVRFKEQKEWSEQRTRTAPDSASRFESAG
jgi:GNAT superfamily N-acetyltransferase